MATQVAALPDDALAGVFRGLPPRSLAVVRCVCKAWRDVVDARALLLQHLHRLPLAVRGVFINYDGHDHPHLLARPCSSPPPSSSSSTVPRIDGTLSFLPKDDRRHRSVVSVLDHCNGLLLCSDDDNAWLRELCVCNPATRRWTVLPRWWEHARDVRRRPFAGAYLAFDPAGSPHYQVVLVPAVPEEPYFGDYGDRCWTAEEMRRRSEKERDAPFCLDWFFSLPEDGGATDDDGQLEFQQQQQHDADDDPCRYMGRRGYMEWPPAPWTLRVFSSSTGRWEDRAFVREGSPAGTIAKMRLDYLELPPLRYAVYHHGSLYVHCRGLFVARISLSKSKYQVIRVPSHVNVYKKPYLGKLQNAICFGIVHYQQLKIWILDEACGQMEWVLKYDDSVIRRYTKYLSSVASGYRGRQRDGSWTIEENIEIIQDIDHDVESLSGEENIEIQDIDYHDESLSEEENIKIQDTNYDDEYLSEEEKIDDESLSEEEEIDIQDTDNDDEESLSEEDIKIQDTDYDDESLSEEENFEIEDAVHDVGSLPKEENIEIHDINHEVESLSNESYEWDSGNDDTFTINNPESQRYFGHDHYDLNIIGFHPYKEVVFMAQEFEVVAYHLNSTKVQYLGNSDPKYCHTYCGHIYGSFLYTPCMIGDLLHGDQTAGPSSSQD